MVLSLVASVSTTLVACGDDDDDGGSGTPTGGTGGTSNTGGSSSAGKGGTSNNTAGTNNNNGGTNAGGTAGTGGSAALGTIVDIAAANEDFSSLVAAVTKAGLVDALSADGPLTVFAPTNDAFDALFQAENITLDDLSKEQLTDILTYHVVAGKLEAADVVEATFAPTLFGADVRIKVDGDNVFLNLTTKVTATDIQASNGVIHVLDGVLMPPGDIPTVATGNPEFSSLVAALVKADLVDALKADGPFTVFAPTNEAFDKLFDTLNVTLDDLTKEQLTPILTYHVVPGKLYSEDVVKATEATTLQGDDVTIEVEGGTVTLNGNSKVEAVDVLAKNGVIHVIDTVLLPPG